MNTSKDSTFIQNILNKVLVEKKRNDFHIFIQKNVLLIMRNNMM